MLNENLSIDVKTGIVSSDREYFYSVQQVNYINYDWQLLIFWTGGEFTTQPEDDAFGEYLYNQKKGAMQDIQRLQDLGYKMIKI